MCIVIQVSLESGRKNSTDDEENVMINHQSDTSISNNLLRWLEPGNARLPSPCLTKAVINNICVVINVATSVSAIVAKIKQFSDVGTIMKDDMAIKDDITARAPVQARNVSAFTSTRSRDGSVL